MRRLTILNRRPGSFVLSDPSGYTNFSGLVPGNEERSFLIDEQVAAVIETRLIASRTVGDIEFSLENDVGSMSDDPKLAVVSVDASRSSFVIPPFADVIVIAPATGAPAAAIALTLPPPGLVRDGHFIEIRDGIGTADTVPITVFAGLYRIELSQDIASKILKGDSVVLSADAAGTARNGAYRVFQAAAGGSGTLVDLLDALPGAVDVSATASVQVIDGNGVVKFGPATLTAVSRAPYFVNESAAAWSIGSTKFAGAGCIMSHRLGRWLVTQVAAGATGGGAGPATFTSVTASGTIQGNTLQGNTVAAGGVGTPGGDTTALDLTASPTNTAGNRVLYVKPTTPLTTSGTALGEFSNVGTQGAAFNAFQGAPSGGQANFLADGYIVDCSGTIADGDVVIWANSAARTVVRSGASAANKAIAGVAIGAPSGGRVMVAMKGLVFVNSEAFNSAPGTMVGTSGTTAGKVDALVDTNIGGLLGRTLENPTVGNLVPGKVLIQLALG